MIVQDAVKRTLIQTLAKWLIVGVFILLVRFLRWGGIVGLVGIGMFPGAPWLAFHLSDPDPGELTGLEGTGVLVLMVVGSGRYILGVTRRRRRVQLMLDFL